MNFEYKPLSQAALASEKCDLLLLLVPEGPREPVDPWSLLIDRALKAGDFACQAGKSLALYQVPGIAARRALLLGAGDGSARAIRQAIGAAAGAIKAPKTAKVVVGSTAVLEGPALRAAVLAVSEAAYTYTTTKSKPEATAIERICIAGPASKEATATVRQTQAVAHGVLWAREWGNRPPNLATPSHLAEAAKALAAHPSIQSKVMDRAGVEKLGMGAFLAVARGSEEPLRFIELRYQGAGKGDAPVVLVGKGITFDTGGISIKPAPEMDEMKFDMCGAASVLGVFEALARMEPRINVVGLIPACENMPDGRAVKPGDVVTSMSGQTIEVLNTDAEGRLILCDALTYADRFKPAAVIDIATLTGACVIALGAVRSGLFSADDALASDLLSAGERALDLCWRMPLDDEYAEGLKSSFADVGNVGGRAAGAVTAAKFLQRFARQWPWAHLDIAGTAWKSGAAKGATGRPVGLLLEYLLARASAATPPAPARARRSSARQG